MANTADFYAQTRDAKKILVVDTGALGDTVHLLPALHMIRSNYPAAEIHTVAGPPEFFRAVAPWVDRPWPGMRRKPADNIELVRALRREHLDAVFVLTGHNRAGLIGNLAGARWRLGRRTDENKPWWWQPLLYTHTATYPWHQEPMYRQHLQILQQCGLKTEAPQFGARVLPEWLHQAGVAEPDRKSYIHVSPYYSFAGKELPPEQYVELLTALHQRYGRVVLSCGPAPRERELLQKLVERLPFQPWKVCAGTLSLEQYIALIDGARLHLSGDSGGLHVSLMTGTPGVCWYRRRWDYRNWAPAPDDPIHRLVLTDDISEDACRGVSTEALLAAAQELLGPA